MSSTELLRRYFSERYRASFFVPLAMLLYITGAVALGTSTTRMRSVLGVAVAYLLVLTFRIRDDVADVEADRRTHPTRITVVAGDLSPLRATMNGASVAVVVLVALSPEWAVGLVAFAAITALLIIWYSLHELRTNRLRNALVILLKYPAIAFISAIAGAAGRTDASAAARPIAGFIAIYAMACTYELLHDRGLRT